MLFPIKNLEQAHEALDAAMAYLAGQAGQNDRLADAAEMARGAALVIQDVLDAEAPTDGAARDLPVRNAA